MKQTHVLILGCGYTGRRVARRLLARGLRVVATTRNPSDLQDWASREVKLVGFDASEPKTFPVLREVLTRNIRVLISIPLLRFANRLFDPAPQLVGVLGDTPSRVVYLSTTGVYGSIQEVDETTPVAPVTEQQHLRLAAEEVVRRGPWSSLVLRAAAIYGPGRGVHVAIREGRFKLVGDGSNFVSRIHVDDLAAHAEQALVSELTGAYPVADEEPCASREIALFCARLLNIPLPPSVKKAEVDETRQANRRVDGRAIRQVLGITLQYPSYRVGIPAALAAQPETPRTTA